MKSFRIITMGAMATLSIGSPAFAQNASHGQMTAAQHKQMTAGHGPASEKVTAATGVVKASDAAKGTITIAHNAVDARNWPAMTMTFKISKGVLGNVKAGQHVKFWFKGEDSYTVTKITRG